MKPATGPGEAVRQRGSSSGTASLRRTAVVIGGAAGSRMASWVTRTRSSPSPRTAARPPVRSRWSGRAARLWPARNTPCSPLHPVSGLKRTFCLRRPRRSAAGTSTRPSSPARPGVLQPAPRMPSRLSAAEVTRLGTALRRRRPDHAARGGLPGVRPAQQRRLLDPTPGDALQPRRPLTPDYRDIHRVRSTIALCDRPRGAGPVERPTRL